MTRSMCRYLLYLMAGLTAAGAPSGVRAQEGAKSRWSRFEYKSNHMGTEWRIVLYAEKAAEADAASRAAFDRVAELEQVMSDYKADSELMKFCRRNDEKPGEPVKLSADLFEVLRRGQQVAELSEGSFDMTVGPLVKLWRQARQTRELPAAADLATAQKLVGYTLVKLDAEARTATLARPGMRLDLGGIGKGYAADAARAVLAKHGFTRVLIAASGDITVGDPPPERPAWIVEIAPIGRGQPSRFVQLTNASVSTSGDLFQYVEIGGVRYSHVLDPNTGLGLTGRRSATVIAREGWRADALTKAASVLSPEKALKIIDGLDGAAMYLVVKGDDNARETVTASRRFRDYEVKPE